ncbi:E3 ubiquitin-protein ligase MARCH9 [Larimichthys crocea]|uniref:RING-type E3 ubiquitin transferase n=3 Tax=Sciaenidae TaxID=30870 RepID=A0A0F8AWB5_LARCR|nr:E3 ubiquitin-protein ligase MARCH9-like [Larimichthys crocea]KAE8298701.1 E3 ubiquitin-protein ligase MARCH9 [Larimichthys crocea]KAE8298717.1 E3 ubiquitin-protein ligase MARCH9 [Larimichthys crocea]TMS19855.1 E3 ubiquitin-protein ligase MARCH9 [Larimichthys crocea]
MFKYRIRMFFNELKVLLLMRSGSSRRTDTGTDPDTQTRMRGLAIGGCGWPPLSCSHRDDEEEYYGSDPRPRSLAFEDNDDEDKSHGGGLDAASLPSLSESGMRSPQCRICFQGPEKGELLSPCRCAGSVRCTHQSCLIRWISERGSWSCELCYFKYQVLAISTKNPLQWQAITLTVIEKVQIAAIILGSLFLIASISWLVWSSLSPSAKWQRQDLLFQICYGMYGFMDIVCIGLIIHEGSSVYRIFKRWQAVNQQWKVLNYEKAKDLGDPISSGSKGRVERDSTITDSRRRASRHVRTILNHHCGYTILHILSQLRPNNLHRANQEVVMRVTTV